MSDDLGPTSAADAGFPGGAASAVDDVIARIATAAVARDGDGDPDRGLAADIRRLAGLGVTAARLPRTAGGSGLSFAQQVELQVLLARADSNVTQSLRTHTTFTDQVARAVIRGEDPQWAAEIAAGQIFAGAITESGEGRTGTVATSLRTDATGTLRLTGVKAYATGTGYADWVSVLASDDDGRHLVATVRADAEGVVLRDDWFGVGQRLTTSGTAEFTDVAVDAAHVAVGEGTPADRLGNLDAVMQITHLATLAGIALRVHDDAVAWLRGRTRHFSHAAASTPAGDPQIQERVGDLEGIAAVVLAAVRDAARTLGDDLALPADEQTLAGHRAVTRAQTVVPSLVLRAAQTLFDLGGGSLVDSRRGFDRHWRNARTLANHNPAHLKARALGARSVAGTELPEIWYVGTGTR
ncbi:acyl-CoA dehydrogenase family protein [Microbacterium sp. RD1]|uniref:acyl-CoA dehydrogenase family protein n=1 Tax=Microbacterium sp. RD1 TaxID=3457313 RepID=UPI003FA5D571